LEHHLLKLLILIPEVGLLLVLALVIEVISVVVVILFDPIAQKQYQFSKNDSQNRSVSVATEKGVKSSCRAPTPDLG
jgi:hypothetical protein